LIGAGLALGAACWGLARVSNLVLAPRTFLVLFTLAWLAYACGALVTAQLRGRVTVVVILTSVGAKSGKVRKNPVMRIVDGDRYVAVASYGGAPENPSWYANLVAHPTVRLQDGAIVKDFRAREVSGEEKRRYWTIAEQFWPHFPEYRRLAAGRDIPIMVLEPIAAPR